MAFAKKAREEEAAEKKKGSLNLQILKCGDALNFPKKFDSIAMYVIFPKERTKMSIYKHV